MRASVRYRVEGVSSMRRFLTVLTALPIVLAACGGGVSQTGAPPPAGSAAPATLPPPSELQVFTNPSFQKSFDQYIVPKMKELYNVTVVGAPTATGEALTKSIAQKDSPKVSVVMLDQA